MAYFVFSTLLLGYPQNHKIPRNIVRKKKKKAFAVFKIPLYKQQNLSLADLGRKGIYLLEYSEGF